MKEEKTLRDYFAGLALQAMMQNPMKTTFGETALKKFPIYAYEWADEMLKAREVKVK